MDQRLRRDVAWNLIPVVLLAIVGLGMNFLIARWWSADALGIFNLVTIAYFVFTVAGAFGLQFSVLRAVAEHADDPDRVAAIVVGALVPGVAITAVATCLFVLLRGPIAALHGSDAVGEGMLWATPGLFCFALNKILFGVVNGLRRMRAFAVYTSLRYLLIGTGLIIAHAFRVKAEHLTVIWTFTEGTLLLVMLGELVINVRLRRCAGWTRWTREHLTYGARGVTATLAQEINSKLDVWMLGAAGVAKHLVGVYSMSAALNEGAMQLSAVVQYNLNPMIARSIAARRPTEVDELARRTRRWFVPAMAGACLLGALAYPVVVPRLVGDPTFSQGTIPFAVLMAGVALASPYLVFNQLLMMAKMPGWHTVFLLLVAGINFVANLTLIPRLGITGAAASTSIAIVGSAVLLHRLARGRVGVRI